MQSVALERENHIQPLREAYMIDTTAAFWYSTSCPFLQAWQSDTSPSLQIRKVTCCGPGTVRCHCRVETLKNQCAILPPLLPPAGKLRSIMWREKCERLKPNTDAPGRGCSAVVQPPHQISHEWEEKHWKLGHSLADTPVQNILSIDEFTKQCPPALP